MLNPQYDRRFVPDPACLRLHLSQYQSLGKRRERFSRHEDTKKIAPLLGLHKPHDLEIVQHHQQKTAKQNAFGTAKDKPADFIENA